MKKIIMPMLTLLLALPLTSLGAKTQKPVKLPNLTVTQTIEIKAPPEAVWSRISDFNGLNTWHPAVAKSEILSGTNNKKGAIRLLTLQDGGTIKEKLLRYNSQGMSFKYSIIEGVLPVSHYISTIRVKPGKDGGSVVEWYGKFQRKSPLAYPPAGEDDATATNTITAVYKAGLENLKKLTEGG
jgi:mxaD protein